MEWWENNDDYVWSGLTPPSFDIGLFAGPRGPALVQVYPDGTTAPGWGERTFMEKYMDRVFNLRRAQVIYDRHSAPFAYVMRSLSLVCIDIDGKNGGVESARQLELPKTLAETSKSGNGYHLFYAMAGTWDLVKGFGALSDRVGFAPGIDFRGTGCVFHYPSQRWNAEMPARLPDEIHSKIAAAGRSLAWRVGDITAALETDDPMEVLIMQDNITSRLAAPIPAGRRNNTLFAIGAEMAAANVPNWEKQVYDRAIEVGLSVDEAEKLVKNVRKYGV